MVFPIHTTVFFFFGKIDGTCLLHKKKKYTKKLFFLINIKTSLEKKNNLEIN